MTIFSRHPVDNPVITQPFGAPNTWEDPPFHKGIDYAGSTSTPIKAPCDGFIVHAGGTPFGYGNTWEQIPGSTNSGNCVIIQPLPPHTAANTSFSHLSRITVEHGQYVRAGDIIGYMGSTGFSFGVHLHWELFIDYAEGAYPPGTFYGRVNPLDYFTTATTVPIGTGGKGTAATTETQHPEEDFMGGTIDAEQAEAIASRAADLVVERLNNKLLINPVQAESIVQSTTNRTVAGVQGVTVNLQQADDVAQAAARYAADEQARRLNPKAVAK